MKFPAPHFLAATPLLLAVIARAADIDGLISQVPQCAFTCLSTSAKNMGCDLSNFTCICNNIVAIQAASASCLATSCSADQVTKLSSLATQICKAIGVGVGGSGTASTNKTSPAPGVNSTQSTAAPAAAGVASVSGSWSAVHAFTLVAAMAIVVV